MAAIAHLLRPFLILSIFFTLSPIISSLTDAEALLKLKKSFTNTESLTSWIHGSDPCDEKNKWNGLICFIGIVTGLRLEDMNLSGKIDVDALLQLHGLRTLSFANNSFSGSIPEFNKLGALKSLYLLKNQFSGEISSDYFAKMTSLKKVWLSENKFSGEIPLSLTKLSHLIELRLENNQFSGGVPDIQLPNLSSFNVSNNKLVGQIPTNMSKFSASSFQGNDGLCGEILGKSCSQAKTDQNSENPIKGDQNATNIAQNGNNSTVSDGNRVKENNKIAAAIMTSGAVLLSLVLVAIVLMKRREEKFEVLEKDNSVDETVEVRVSGSCRKENPHEMSRKNTGSSRKGSVHGKGVSSVGDLVMVNDEKGMFGLSDLMKAAAEVLGNGGLGSSYKAMISNEVTVVVKRMRDMNKIGKEDFDAEIRQLGRLKHQNILTPLAYHYRRDEKLLVYEYIPNGSLLYLLHGMHIFSLSHSKISAHLLSKMSLVELSSAPCEDHRHTSKLTGGINLADGLPGGWDLNGLIPF